MTLCNCINSYYPLLGGFSTKTVDNFVGKNMKLCELPQLTGFLTGGAVLTTGKYLIKSINYKKLNIFHTIH